jgi:tripartite-type tricarboxylate transporter receptor subunit TctC
MTSAHARSAQLPNVPTAREAGFADLEAIETFGLLLPSGAPQSAIAALNAALRNALANAAVREGLGRLSFEPAVSSPDDHAGLIRSDLASWADVVRTLKFKPLN